MIDFKIALYGQIDNDSKYGFTYPDNFNPINMAPKDEWLRSVIEPRDARVFKTDEPIYTIWKNEHGNYYATIVPNKKDSRNGYLILALFVGKMQVKSGKTLVGILTELIHMIIEQGGSDKSLITAYLETVADAFEPDNMPVSTTQKTLQKAFRAYDSEDELYDLLQNINQEEYNSYKRVMFVPRASVPSPLTNDYVELKNVIRHIYNILLPADGTQVNRRMVKDGEPLEITYSKTGYEQEKREVIVQRTPNDVYTIEDNSIRIKSAAEMGIKFMRGFTLDVRSTSGIEIKEFTVNGARHKYGDKIKMEDAHEYAFTFKANGYDTLSMSKRASEMTTMIKARLQPQEIEMPVSMNHRGREIRGRVMIKADDPLYKYFKSNDYRFEIKGGSRAGGAGKKNGMLNMILCAVAALGLIIAGLFIYKSCDAEEEEIDNTTQQTDSINNKGNVPKKEDVREDSLTEEQKKAQRIERALIYLKRKGKDDVWKQDSLKDLPEYREIFDFLKNGEIQKIINWKYSVREEDEYTNTLWKNILKYLELAQDRPEEIELVRERLKMSVTGDSVDLRVLRIELGALLDNQQEIPTPTSGNHQGNQIEGNGNIIGNITKTVGSGNNNGNKKVSGSSGRPGSGIN